MILSLMQQEWFVSLITVIVTAVGAGISTLIALFFKRLADKIAASTKNEKYAQIVDTVGNLVRSAVLATQQTFVEQLKRDGKFDKDTQKQALEIALKSIMSQLSKEMTEALNELFGDLELWLTTQIEAYIALKKEY